MTGAKLTTGPIAAGDWDEFFRRLEERDWYACPEGEAHARRFKTFSEAWAGSTPSQRLNFAGWVARVAQYGTDEPGLGEWFWRGNKEQLRGPQKRKCADVIARVRTFLGVPS